MTRRALTLLLTAGALLAFSGSALAYWTAGGSGRGVAGTGTLAAPTVSVPATSGRSVTVHWGAQATLNGAAIPEAIYRVQRKGPGEPGYTTLASGGCAAPVGYPASECADSVPADGTWTYRVVAVYRSWTAISDARSVDVVPAELGAAEATSPAEPAATEIARPAAPESVTATAVAGGDIALAWDAVPGADGYRVYRRTATGSYGDATPVTATEFRDPGTGLNDGERYVYMVRAVAGLESLDSAEAEARSDSRAPAYGASAVALSSDGWINAASATDASARVDLSGPGEAGDVVAVTIRDAAGAEVTRRAPVVAGIGSVTVGGIDASPLAEVSSSVADPAGARNLQVTATVADAAGNVNAAATATAPAGKDVTAPPANGPDGLAVTYSDGRLAGSGEPFDTISAVREGADGTVYTGGTVQADGAIAAFAVGVLAPGETGVFHRVTETDPAGNALTLPFGPFAA